MILERIFGPSESLLVTDTQEFDDYSKYVSSAIDPEAKSRRRREVFPEECKQAFHLGKRRAQAGKKVPGR